MKRILILIIGLFGVAHAQFAPTSAKTAFKNGVSVGTRDSTAYNAADSLVVVINRQGRLMYRSTDGYWKLLANAASSDYVPYTGAVDNVALGNFRLTARSLRTDSIYANGSGGAVAVTNSGTKSLSWGAGGSSEVTFYGFAGMDFNRSGSMTNTSFTPKVYVDSLVALRVLYTDTAAMLSPFVQYSDTVNMLSPYRRTSTLIQQSEVSGLSTSLAAKLNISDTATMLSPYRRTSTKITNSDLVNSTISGVALGSNLNNLSAGNGLSGTAYNGSAAQTWQVDTSTISTKANVTGSLVAKANTSLNNVNGVLSSTYGGAGSVSGILKANGSGVVSAAVAGTDYAPAVAGGYLPLSGGTLTGALNGTSLSMSGGGSFGGNVLLGSGSASGSYRLTVNGDASSVASGAIFRANGTDVMYFGNISAANTTDWEIWNPRNGYTRFGNNNVEVGRFASDGTFLINTTTTDGTNKLIVNGGVKGNNFQITARSSSNALQFPDWRVYNTSGNNFSINNYTTDVFSIASTGAATFSSSVTATGFFESSSKKLKDIFWQSKQEDNIDFIGFT